MILSKKLILKSVEESRESSSAAFNCDFPALDANGCSLSAGAHGPI